MNDSEEQDEGVDIEVSRSKQAHDESPNGLSGAPEEVVSRKPPVTRKVMGPRLPQLQPAIHSASTPAGGRRPYLLDNCLLKQTNVQLRTWAATGSWEVECRELQNFSML